ncbi:MAG: hypothetical protein J3K34DRAFT_273714 [Monoraphidium minutum]|nr:MAG: hypothetical protein J3K34DRAFT_273714 [Monoraphidium minutum]
MGGDRLICCRRCGGRGSLARARARGAPRLRAAGARTPQCQWHARCPAPVRARVRGQLGRSSQAQRGAGARGGEGARGGCVARGAAPRRRALNIGSAARGKGLSKAARGAAAAAAVAAGARAARAGALVRRPGPADTGAAGGGTVAAGAGWAHLGEAMLQHGGAGARVRCTDILWRQAAHAAHKPHLLGVAGPWASVELPQNTR